MAQLSNESNPESVKIKLVLMLFAYRRVFLQPSSQPAQKDFCEKCFQWIITLIRGDDALSLMAVNLVVSCHKEAFVRQFFSSRQPEIYQKIMLVLPETHSTSFFTFARYFFKSQEAFFCRETQLLPAFVSLLLEKIRNLLSSSDPNRQNLVNTCLTTMNALMKVKQYASLFFEVLDKFLLSFRPFFGLANFEYHEEIIKLCDTLTTQGGLLPKTAQHLFESVEKIQQKFGGKVFDLIPLINNLLEHFPHFFTPATHQQFLNVLRISLGADPAQANQPLDLTSDNYVDGIVLTQLFIQYLHADFTDETFQSLLKISFDLLQIYESNQGSMEKNCDKVVGIFMHLAIYFPQKVFGLVGAEVTRKVLGLAFQKMTLFVSQLDKKMLLNFLVTVARQAIASSDTDLLITVLDRLIPFLKLQEVIYLIKLAEMKAQRKLKNELINKAEIYNDYDQILSFLDIDCIEIVAHEPEEPKREGENGFANNIDIEELITAGPNYLYEKRNKYSFVRAPITRRDELQELKEVMRSFFGLNPLLRAQCKERLGERARAYFDQVIDRFEYTDSAVVKAEEKVVREIVKYKKAVKSN